MNLACSIRRETFRFNSIKDVLAKANEEKSGDRLAGISARSEEERVAAKEVLSGVQLKELRANPVLDHETDEVTRIIDDNIDSDVWNDIASWTVSSLREFILDCNDAQELRRLSRGLTGEIAAAVTKLMSNLDLVRAAGKILVRARANTTLGLDGVLGARLQPNHPADAVDGIRASIFEGIAYGIGDAVIGINPVFDTAESVEFLLRETDRVIMQLGLPTQNCILSHITTQMKAVERGAPAGLLFQSIAGCEAGNKAFGIDLALLKEAHELGAALCKNAGGQFLYFETGQGSELSSRTHNDADQLTLEARCYAMARCFRPFLVNDVVGFIGPEYLADGRQMIRAGLEDHFMGKLLGVPMGIDACYTNHMEADQNDLENSAILLVSAGVNYFMGVPLGDDVMLSYQTTSFHDVATLRELAAKRPAPEFEEWLVNKGIMNDGRLTTKAGDASYIARLCSTAVT